MKHALTFCLVLTGMLPLVGLSATNSTVKLTAPAKTPTPVEAKPVVTNEAKKPLLALTQPVATNEKKKPLLTLTKPATTNAVGKPLPAFVKSDAAGIVKSPADETTDEGGEKKKETPKTEDAEKKPPAVSAAPVTDNPKFARYKTIMDRMPFGPEPVNFDPDKPGSGMPSAGGTGAQGVDQMSDEAAVSAAEQQIQSSVRVAAINVTPSGKIAVGFTDGTKQPASSYYIKVGEERDGWKVLEADAKELTAKLEKEGVAVTLKLGEGPADGKGGAKKPGLIPMAGNRPSLSGGMRPLAAGARPTPNVPSAEAGSALANLRARRQRKEAERQAEAAQAKQAAALAKEDREKAAAEREKAAAEREQQREALLQIQEELRKQREAREQQQQQQPPDAPAVPPPQE